MWEIILYGKGEYIIKQPYIYELFLVIFKWTSILGFVLHLQKTPVHINASYSYM